MPVALARATTRRHALAERMPALRLASAIFIVAVIVNDIWEFSQRFLYVGVADTPGAFWHCFVASLGDGVLTVAIYVAGCITFGHRGWYARAHRWRLPFVLLAGGGVGVAVEWIGARILQRWAYAPAMPVIPGLELGLVPVLQMIVLPVVVFHIVAAAAKLRT